MEVDDVLADEMNLLGLRIGEKALEVNALFLAIVLEAGEITDGGIQPDVEILSRRVGDGNAEVGRVARDVPVTEDLVAFALQPFLRLVRDLRLQAVVAGPLAQELHALGIR